jgi:hypothetical protein
MSWFDSKNEISHPQHPLGDWRLCFQWGDYVHDDKSRESGYRFIWRRPNNSIQARPARLPSIADIELLTKAAREGGWGDHSNS